MSDTPKKPSWKDRLKSTFDSAKKTGADLIETAKEKGKVVYDDAVKNGKETLDTVSILVNKEQKDGEPKKDLTLQDRAAIAKEHLGKTDWVEVAKDTAQDITKKEELKKLAGTILTPGPGGIFLYGAYRVAKHRKEKMEEEAAKAAEAKPVTPPPVPETPPAPPTPAADNGDPLARRRRPPRPPRNPSQAA